MKTTPTTLQKLKKALAATLLALALASVAGTAAGCLSHARKSRAERVKSVLAQMEIVEIDHLGYVRYDGAVTKPGDFARRLNARREALAGKPVLLSVNPELAQNQPEIEPYIRRVLARCGLGEIYTSVPVSLPPREEPQETDESENSLLEAAD